MSRTLAGAVTLFSFPVGALGFILITFVTARIFQRDPSAYWRAFRTGQIFTIPFLRGYSSRAEYASVIVGIVLFMSMLLWLLVATLLGWLG